MTINLSNPKKIFLASCILFLVVGGTYVGKLTNGFVWDDFDFIVTWPALREFPQNWQLLMSGELPGSHDHAYRPLRSIFYGLSFLVWQLNPLGYQLQGLLIHILASGVVGLISYQLNKKIWPSSLIALTFGVFPKLSESVYWITANFDTLGNLFFLVSFYAYIKSTQKDYWYWSAVGLAILAFFTYELTLTLPLILFLFDYLVRRQTGSWKHYLPFLIPNGLYWWLRLFVFQVSNDKPYMFESLLENIRTMLALLANYVWHSLYPFKLSVNHLLKPDLTAFFYADYNMLKPAAPFTWTHPLVILGLLIVAGLAWVWWQRKFSSPWLQFGLFAFIICLIPVLQLFPRSIIFSERYLYLSLAIGLSFSLSYLYQQLPKSSLGILNWILVCLIAVMAVTTFQRHQAWYTNQTLWQSSLETTPTSITMYRNLGDSYFRAGDYAAAATTYEQGLDIYDQNYNIHNDLGLAYIELRQFDQAIQAFQEVVRLTPNQAFGYLKLADIYFVLKEYQLAQTYYQEALIRPSQYQEYARNKLLIIEQLESATTN